MKPENQVCNLELSKRLKELGVPQESFFYWVEDDDANKDIVFLDNHHHYVTIDDFDEAIIYEQEITSAFTVAELGEMLPDSTTLTRQAVSGRWRYPDINGSSLYAKTEADARAKMLIYLLENKLIKL